MTPANHADQSLIGMIDNLAGAEELFSLGRTAEALEQLERLRSLTHHAVRLHAQVLTDLAVIAGRAGDRGTAVEPQAWPGGDLQATRIEQFARLSTCQHVSGAPVRRQPLLLLGAGRISFGESVSFGWPLSPGFYDQSAYVEAAREDTHIEIGDETLFNNGVTLRAEGPGISIGRDCLFGWSVNVLDSDFHDLHPRRRRTGTPAARHVSIGNNVFLGANTQVLKGVTIGDDTVVGAGSVVLRSLPAGVIAGGNPARVIKPVEDEERSPA